MITITPDQRIAIQLAGEVPVPVTDPDSNDAYRLVKAEVFDRMRSLLGDELEHREWLDMARRGRSAWLDENA